MDRFSARENDSMSHLKLALVLGGCMGAASFGIDSLTPGLPQLAQDFNVSPGHSQLALTLGMLGFSLGQIPAGIASDRYGRRLILYVALGIFVLASLVAPWVTEFNVLLALRVLQGMSLAGLAVSARAIVRDVATGVDAGAMMSVVTTVMAMATVMAPLAGGVSVTQWGWQAVFLVMAVYGLVCLIPVTLVVPSTRRKKRNLSPGRQMAASFRKFFRNRQSVRGALVNGLAFGGLFGFVTGAAALASDVYQLAPKALGPAIAVIPLMLVVAAQISRVLVRKLGLSVQERLAVMVMGVAASGQIVAALMATPPLVLVWGMAMIYALGFGLLMPVVTAQVLDPQPRSAAFAAAILGTCQSGAGAVVSALVAATYNQTALPLCLVMGVSGLAAGAAAIGINVYPGPNAKNQ